MSLINENLTCPACRASLEHTRWAQYPVPVSTRTDFHEQHIGDSRLRHECLICVECGFAARDVEWTGGEGLAEYYGAYIRATFEPTRLLLPEMISDRFERAAKCAEIIGRPTRYVGDLYLRAAWACVEDNDIEAERYYRRKAVWMFEEAMAAYGGVSSDEKLMIAYLTGELWRRIGDRIKAHDWFVQVESFLEDEDDRWLIAAAKQQDEAPLEWFAK